MLGLFIIMFVLVKRHIIHCFKILKDSLSIGFVINCAVCISLSVYTGYLLYQYDKSAILTIEVEPKPQMDLTKFKEDVKYLIIFADEFEKSHRPIPEANVIKKIYRNDKRINIECRYTNKNPSLIRKPFVFENTNAEKYISKDFNPIKELSSESFKCKTEQMKMKPEFFHIVKWEHVFTHDSEPKQIMFVQTYLDGERTILPDLYNGNIEFKFFQRKPRKQTIRKISKEDSLVTLFLIEFAKSRIA